MTLLFRPFIAADALALSLQLSQIVTAGIECKAMSAKEARDLEAGGEAWTATNAAGDIICCAGIYVLFSHPETDVPVHATAWAMLSEGIGGDHVALTRFARHQILTSPVRRIECIVRADYPAEPRWARLCGMEPAAVLRDWGALSETHILFERLLP